MLYDKVGDWHFDKRQYDPTPVPRDMKQPAATVNFPLAREFVRCVIMCPSLLSVCGGSVRGYVVGAPRGTHRLEGPLMREGGCSVLRTSLLVCLYTTTLHSTLHSTLLTPLYNHHPFNSQHEPRPSSPHSHRSMNEATSHILCWNQYHDSMGNNITRDCGEKQLEEGIKFLFDDPV